MTTLINIFPRATEKAYGLSKSNVYVFDVPVSANKQQILDAIEGQFNVKTVNIKTLVQTGKGVRASRGKRAYPSVAFRKDMKKAYVTLAEGDKIKVFDEPEQPVDKKSDKKETK